MTVSRTQAVRPIAITMGDPAGIGPEIIARLAADPARRAVPLLVIGDAGVMARAAALVGAPLRIETVAAPAGATSDAGQLSVLQTLPAVPADLAPGRVDARAGAAAYAAVNRALELATAGEIGAVVTAPVHKEAWSAAGSPYPGHTEMLADRTGTREFAMMMVNDELRTVLVSIHISLQAAIAAVSRESELRAMRLADRAARAYGIARPRIAVAGLNPHAGEGGKFGREEIEIIAPAIAEARGQGLDVSGPYAGDTVFMRARRGEFDIVVAQYHDQGLIPIKYLGLDHGVNVTVGLPFVRTSVDHGTAFDIAGRGIADHRSLMAALRHAIILSADRTTSPARAPAAT